MEPDSDFDGQRTTAQFRLAALERLKALYRLQEQARESGRGATHYPIEVLIQLERKALARYRDDEPG